MLGIAGLWTLGEDMGYPSPHRCSTRPPQVGVAIALRMKSSAVVMSTSILAFSLDVIGR